MEGRVFLNSKKYQEQMEIPDEEQGMWPNYSWPLLYSADPVVLSLTCFTVLCWHSTQFSHSPLTALTVTGFIKTHGFPVIFLFPWAESKILLVMLYGSLQYVILRYKEEKLSSKLLDFELNWNNKQTGKYLLAGPLCSGEGSHDSANSWLYSGWLSPIDAVTFTC